MHRARQYNGSARAYRALLLLFPRRFRAARGMAMEHMFVDMYAQRRSEGRRAGPRFWLRLLWDTAWHAAGERFRPSSGPLRPRRGTALEDLLTDLRYSLRGFRRNPGFAAVAVITMALGMAGSANIFGMFYSMVLAPLPYGDPDGLAVIWSSERSDPDSRASSSIPDYGALRDRNRTFEDLSAFSTWQANLTGAGDEPLRLFGYHATANLLDVLRVEPLIGRKFVADDGREGTDPVIILAWRIWQRLGADRELVGRTLRIDDIEHTVVGVMPREFEFPQFQFVGDFWTPLRLRPADYVESRGRRGHTLIGRLSDDVTIEAAQADLWQIGEQLEQEYPDSNTDRRPYVIGLHDQMAQPLRPALLVMLVAVGFVLLICCANVATLLLARASVRQAELGVRVALGASRSRIVRQLLTESVVLAVLGGACGLVLSRVTDNLIVAGLPSFVVRVMPNALEAQADIPVMLYTFALALVTGLIFGLVPALRASDPGALQEVRSGARGIAGEARRGRLRSLLVVSEVAVSVILVACAGLMIKGFVGLLEVDAGFDPENVLTLRLTLPEARYDTPESLSTYYDEILQGVRSVDTVTAAGATSLLPLGFTDSRTTFLIEGLPQPEPGQAPGAGYRSVTPGYLEAMRASLRRGRLIDAEDRADTAPVVVVNEALVNRHWPGEDPIGKRLRHTNDETWMEIVGVVGDIRHTTLLMPANPAMFMPVEQRPRAGMSLAIRTTGDPLESVAAIRERIWSIDSELPVADVATLSQMVDDSLFVFRLPTYFIGVFGVIALVIAAVGLYGVLAFLVAQRGKEIGIRVALGARGVDVLRVVVGRALSLALVGIALGSVAAYAVGQLLAAVLEGVDGNELGIYVGVPALLLAVTALASYVPALRALRVDPVVSLRSE